MQLFYAPDLRMPLHVLPPDESRHCVRVLRLGRGDTLWLTDGRGTLCRAVVEEPDPRGCTVRIVETHPDYGRRPYRLTLAVAPTKSPDRTEWMLEKATEAGVDRIVPLVCDRSERRTFRADRARRVLTSAMKQSLSTRLPLLDEPIDVGTFLARPFEGVRLIAHCEADAPRTHAADALPAGRDCLILIGPEGDFSPREIDLALQAGCVPVTLGAHRLRTETAAVAAALLAAFVNHC